MSERDQLARLVEQWNENRLDLFHLSYPTEDLEIEGVMRFYFQDGGERVLTKCVRVSSTATTRAVVEALSEKFLPDLKMLTDDQYSLWEVHENGSERRLEEEEKPLLVQLNWHRDDREGRFLLRRDKHATIPLSTIQLQEDNTRRTQQRYGKKEKKELKKKHQRDIVTVNGGREEPLVSTDIYRQVPENTFTRTISNPEVVMKRKREKKWEARLREMGHGGSLKIYGGELVPSRPYVSILVSVADRADKILAEAAEKYGVDNRNGDFVLVELPVLDHRHSSGDVAMEGGRIVNPDECPLQKIAMKENGPDTYLAIRRRPSDYRVPSTFPRDDVIPSSHPMTSLPSVTSPAFLVLQPDGTASHPNQWIPINSGVTEVGCDPSLAQFAQSIFLDAAEVCGRHCVITYMEGVVTITPSASEARIELNGRRISQTEIVPDGAVLVIGRTTMFRFAANKDSPFLTPPPSNREQLQQQDSDYSHIGQAMVKTSSLSVGSGASSRHSSDQLPNGAAPYSCGAIGAPLNLPVELQIGDYKVWDYLVEVMSRGWSDSGSFRLSPAYALYLALRFFHVHSKPYFVQFFTRIGHHMNQIAQECTSRDELLFWLANASELAFIVERNPDLRTPRSAQLGSIVECVFRRLCTVLLGALRPACQPLLNERLSDQDATAELICLLDSTLRAARASRLNPALTIQLSSQMFHTINATLFNNMVGMGTSQAVHLTTRLGRTLMHNLTQLHTWAEQMGVELAAECHLDRCRQAAVLLAAQKNDVAALGGTCYKLNSIQVRYLLSHFMVGNGEIPCDNDVIARIVGLAERQADQITMQDGLPLTLEEGDQLSLPFLLPQDGYTAEQLRSVPEGLLQYLYGLQAKGLCHSVNLAASEQPPIAQPSSVPSQSASHSNLATPPTQSVQRSVSQTTLTSTQFGDSFGSTGDDIVRVTLRRGGGGIGLSIVAAQGIGDRQTGIYVKKVVDGTPASMDGRLSAGDQLLSVNGQSLLGITQEEAAHYMSRSGAEVHLEVRKGAANRNGLATWLQANTPTGQPPSTSAMQPAQPQHMPPSPAMSHSMHSQVSGRNSQNPSGPPSYSHYAPLPKYSNQQAPPTSYQQRQASSRSSAFHPPQATVEPNRHVRSISASDLYQNNDPNTSISQRSITSTTGGGFDRLPAHYRQSGRPTVVQPGRPLASPTALRRGAPSPVSMSGRPPSANGLHRPPSVTNLFAPPKSPTPLQQHGYSSNGTRESQQDLFRASIPSTPPHAHSSPKTDYPPSLHSHPPQPAYSASLPSPLRPTNNPYQTNSYVPRATVGPNNGYSMKYRQEPVVVRPQELGINRDNVNGGRSRDVREEAREHLDGRGSREDTRVNVRGAVPTAITQALALQAASAAGAPSRVARPRPSVGGDGTTADRDVRSLERDSRGLMTRESIDDELDRLDAKGVDMSEAEKKRYRELLNQNARVGPATSRATEEPAAITASRRTETLIDDIQPDSARENVSPLDSRRIEKKSVQFEDEQGGSRRTFDEGKEEIDSPGIVGGNEVYLDPRQRLLNQQPAPQQGPDGSRLEFRDKMRLFAHQIGENTPQRTRYHASSAERHIQQE